MQQAYRPLLEDLGLTYPQYLVLCTIWTARNPLTVKGIGQQVHLDSSTLTPLLKRLEASGLVIRTRDPEDERQVRITLTEAGHALRDRTAHIPACMLEKTGLDIDTLVQLQTQISALAARLRNPTDTAPAKPPRAANI